MIKTLAEANAHQVKNFGRSILPSLEPIAVTVERKGRQKNKTEAEYERILKIDYPDAVIRYEAYTLKLAPSLRYCPDFSVTHKDRSIDFYEVKGSFVWARALNKPKNGGSNVS